MESVASERPSGRPEVCGLSFVCLCTHAEVAAAARRRSLEELMLNLNCNAVSGVQITHHFVRLMVRPHHASRTRFADLHPRLLACMCNAFTSVQITAPLFSFRGAAAARPPASCFASACLRSPLLAMPGRAGRAPERMPQNACTIMPGPPSWLASCTLPRTPCTVSFRPRLPRTPCTVSSFRPPRVQCPPSVHPFHNPPRSPVFYPSSSAIFSLCFTSPFPHFPLISSLATPPLQIERKLRGCVVFTSSAAAAMPSPFSVQYAATKSFVSAFGASLAPEVRPSGIDVLVFHPSPVASRYGAMPAQFGAGHDRGNGRN
eukprot:350435-Chlamydomonas_euryale.AAC.9